jgi:Spy/CpxP family protein refolding chaperone
MKRSPTLLLAAWLPLAGAAAALGSAVAAAAAPVALDAADAAPPAAAPVAAADDPIAQNLFPPELIMKYSGEIALDPQQRGAIKAAVQQAQSKFLDAQWELQEETPKMVRLLQSRPVDEKAVLAEADRVLDLERQIKRTQLSLLVRLKNLLTPAQQTRLAELRRAG